MIICVHETPFNLKKSKLRLIYEIVEETMLMVPRDVQMLKAPRRHIARCILMFGGGIIFLSQLF